LMLHQTTTSTPEQFIAGLTDFGPGRSKLFGNSADEYIKGRVLGFVLGIFGERVLGRELEKSVRAIEARNKKSVGKEERAAP